MRGEQRARLGFTDHGRGQFDQLALQFGVGQRQFGIALAVRLQMASSRRAIAQQQSHARGATAGKAGIDLRIDATL